MNYTDKEIYSARIVQASLSNTYQAFANPAQLIRWWGPKGFTNTFHEFDLRPQGRWILTMHGPEKGNYENASVFEVVEPEKLIRWKRISQPHFVMEIGFEAIDEKTSKISFRMIFQTKEACDKIRRFAEPANEENFDRLEDELLKL